MARRKLPYQEGDLIKVPVGLSGKRGKALGLIARADGKGLLLCYCYLGDPDLTKLRARDADLVLQAGDLGLLKGVWNVLGPLPGFRRQDWPLPQFSRRDVVSGVYRLIRYDEDTLEELDERHVSEKEAARHPQDGTSGYGAVQIKLEALAEAQAQAQAGRARALRRAG